MDELRIKITQRKEIVEKKEFLFDLGTYYFSLIEDNEIIKWVKVIISQFRDSDFLFNIEYEFLVDEWEDRKAISYTRIECEPNIPWNLEQYFLEEPREEYHKIGSITEQDFIDKKVSLKEQL